MDVKWKWINLLGSSIAIIILLVCCLIFIFRIIGQNKTEYWLGIILIATALPLFYLLLTASHFNRPILFYLQIAIMIIFLAVELFLDYIFKVDFRNIKWLAIPYVILFFAGTGGMIGIASQSGRFVTIIAVVLFFIMTFLAFYQHFRTGM